jgi:NADH-quinone oxidoreductase subunit F
MQQIYNEPSPLEVRVLTKRFQLQNPWSIDTYLETGGYQAFLKAREMTPAQIIDEVKTSNLRGRGGAGFPTGMKWSFVPRQSPKPKYIICNADESEPGTCKDRLLMEFDPHQLIEGMMIAGLSVDSHKGYIYIRGEYRYLIEHMDRAIAEAYARGWLGKNIQGTGFDFDCYTHSGAGRLRMRRRDGAARFHRRQARNPAVEASVPGGGGRVAVSHHPEQRRDLLAVPAIIHDGGAAFAALGTPKNGGTRLFCLSGHVNKPGVYELPMGFNLLRMIERGRRRHAERQEVEGGDPRRIVLPGSEGRRMRPAMDYDTLAKAKSMLGSGRRRGNGRGHLHGARGHPHHEVLRARKLRMVRSLPRRHNVVEEDSGPFPRGTRRSQRHRPDRRCQQENIWGARSARWATRRRCRPSRSSRSSVTNSKRTSEASVRSTRSIPWRWLGRAASLSEIMADLVTLTIDGKTVKAPAGTLVIDAAKQVGIEIPSFCYYEGLTLQAACRMCLVEIEKAPKLMVGCTLPVAEGMVVLTDSPTVAAARKSTLEFLLTNHPLDCPVCDKGGECELQDMVFRYGAGESRFTEMKLHVDEKQWSPVVFYDGPRCILCYRCIRICDEGMGVARWASSTAAPWPRSLRTRVRIWSATSAARASTSVPWAR